MDPVVTVLISIVVLALILGGNAIDKRRQRPKSNRLVSDYLSKTPQNVLDDFDSAKELVEQSQG